MQNCPFSPEGLRRWRLPKLKLDLIDDFLNIVIRGRGAGGEKKGSRLFTTYDNRLIYAFKNGNHRPIMIL